MYPEPANASTDVPVQRGAWAPQRASADPDATAVIAPPGSPASDDDPTMAWNAAPADETQVLDRGATAGGTLVADPDAEDAGTDDTGAVDLLTSPDESDPEDPPASAPLAREAAPDDTAPDEAAPDDTAAEAGTAPRRPGELPETRISVWAAEDAESFRVRLREAGNQFVDDPTGAVTAVAGVVTEAVDALVTALERRHTELDPHQLAEHPDTESLRVAIRRYREFLDRLLAL